MRPASTRSALPPTRCLRGAKRRLRQHGSGCRARSRAPTATLLSRSRADCQVTCLAPHRLPPRTPPRRMAVACAARRSARSRRCCCRRAASMTTTAIAPTAPTSPAPRRALAPRPRAQRQPRARFGRGWAVRPRAAPPRRRRPRRPPLRRSTVPAPASRWLRPASATASATAATVRTRRRRHWRRRRASCISDRRHGVPTRALG